jgi:MFS family permease
VPMPPAYRRLQLANLVDSVGDGAFAAAVPLLAVTITRDPRLVSLVGAATYLPWLLLSLPFGALIDRHDRVRLMWRSQVAQTGVVALLATLAAYHRVGTVDLVALAFALGCCEVLFGISAQAVLPELVPADQLARANGRQYAVMTTGQLFIGPPLGSLLFGVAVALPFGVNAGSFAISAALLATLPRPARAGERRTSLRGSITEGLRWLGRHRLLRTLAALLGVNTFCGQLGNATLVLFATETLHVSTRGYGLLLTGAAAGSVLGGLVNAGVAARIGSTAGLFVAVGGTALAYLGTGLAPDVLVLGGFMALNAFFVTLWNVVTLTFRQRLVPTELLGRVNSAYRMLGWGLMPVGAVTGGLVAHSYGLRAPYVVAFAIRLLALVAAAPVLLRALRAIGVTEPPGDGQPGRPASSAPAGSSSR